MDGKLNIDDANLPTTGKVWDAMVEHVLRNLSDADLKERSGITVDMFDDEEIREHIQDSGIPVDAIYDEDDLPAKWTQPIFNRGFLEGQTDTMKLVRELQREVARLEKKLDEAWKERNEVWCDGCADELARKTATDAEGNEENYCEECWQEKIDDGCVWQDENGEWAC
jgi:hypothetical protein